MRKVKHWFRVLLWSLGGKWRYLRHYDVLLDGKRLRIQYVDDKTGTITYSLTHDDAM